MIRPKNYYKIDSIFAAVSGFFGVKLVRKVKIWNYPTGFGAFPEAK